MFASLGRWVVTHPWRVIIAWLAAAIAVLALAPGLTTTNNEADFLPGHYESIKADKLQSEAFPNAFSPSVIIVASRTDGGTLSSADSAKMTDIAGELTSKRIDNVQRITPSQLSPNKRVLTTAVQMPDRTDSNAEELNDSVKELRTALKPLAADSGLEIGTTGSAAQSLDQSESTASADAIIMAATIALIVILLLVIFRSPILALLPIVVIGLVSQVSDGLVAGLVKAFDLQADPSTSQLQIIVLFGVGTDYILFLMFRYREQLRAGEEPKEAMITALARVGEAITSAAGVVIAAFAAMSLSYLAKSMGPALAIAVAITLIAGLTLVPAVVSLIGPRIFWPSKSWQREPEAARFNRLGRAMGTRPAMFALVSGVVMVALAAGLFSFRPNFDLAASGLPEDAESRVAMEQLQKGLPAGATAPTEIFLDSSGDSRLSTASLSGFADSLREVKGVGNVAQPELNQNGTTASYSVTLDANPKSDEAIDVVKGPLRSAAHDAAPDGTVALVGGTTAVYADLNAALNRDYSVVFSVTAVLILLILALLLRSLVAPWYLLASVALGFVATLGAATVLFQSVLGEPGLLFMLPLIMFMFVVAVGTDYNILMMARLREEARRGQTPRETVQSALRHTGPTIAAAGAILAGSFAALVLAGNAQLAQMGFSISFGIAVVAFLMALLFTPALTALIGHRAWWPGHADAPSAASAAVATPPVAPPSPKAPPVDAQEVHRPRSDRSSTQR